MLVSGYVCTVLNHYVVTKSQKNTKQNILLVLESPKGIFLEAFWQIVTDTVSLR